MNSITWSTQFGQLMFGMGIMPVEGLRRGRFLGVDEDPVEQDRRDWRILNHRRLRPRSLLRLHGRHLGILRQLRHRSRERDAIVSRVEDRLLHEQRESVPPFTLVIAPLGTPGLAGVPRPGLADTPPHGAIFCGSPSRF